MVKQECEEFQEIAHDGVMDEADEENEENTKRLLLQLEYRGRMQDGGFHQNKFFLGGVTSRPGSLLKLCK